MRKTVILLIVVCFAGLITTECNGQLSVPDSAGKLTAAAYFTEAIGSQSEIYNGVVYTMAPPATKGTFYFQDRVVLMPSVVCYNGRYYQDVPVLYDEHNDEMISSLDGRLFILIKSNLSDIYISGHHFVNIRKKNTYRAAQGYYDELYNGRSRVLVKRTKLIEERIVPPQTPETFYTDKAVVYIGAGNSFTAVSNRSDVLKAFGEHKRELERYIDTNKIDFHEDPEGAAVKVAAYYDQLN